MGPMWWSFLRTPFVQPSLTKVCLWLLWVWKKKNLYQSLNLKLYILPENPGDFMDEVLDLLHDKKLGKGDHFQNDDFLIKNILFLQSFTAEWVSLFYLLVLRYFPRYIPRTALCSIWSASLKMMMVRINEAFLFGDGKIHAKHHMSFGIIFTLTVHLSSLIFKSYFKLCLYRL